MSVSKITGKVELGCLLYDSPIKLQNRIDKLEGCRFEFDLIKEKKEVSPEQRGYYWACIIPHVRQGLFDASGEWHTEKEVHGEMKIKFIGIKKIKIGKTHVTKLPSTEKLGTVGREEYHSDIRKWAWVYLNIVIPLPKEDMSWLNKKA